MPRTSAELMMERETRVGIGSVPSAMLDPPLAELSWRIAPDEFLLRAAGHHYFHYRRKDGITIERGAGADVSEEHLWLNGSVYAAIASLNGLLPIHASAVAAGGKVYAFTGSAGAGKSTLIAALGNYGLPMFSDDTLVLDLSEAPRIMCLPGHKRLKLTAESLDLTGAPRQEKVSRTVEKFYSTSASGDVGVSLPLAELIFLEEGSDLVIEPISGFERFSRLQDEHYTAHLFAGAQAFDAAGQFAHLANLANLIEMSRFVRPLDRSRFDEGVELMASYLQRRATGGQ
jgi:hypothetical protein